MKKVHNADARAIGKESAFAEDVGASVYI